MADSQTAALSPGLAPDREAAILRRCQAGDWSCYGEVVDRYRRLVWAAVTAAGADEARAEDLVQEAFIRAYEKLYLFSFGSSFACWLYRLARNHALSASRKQRRDAGLLASLADEHQAAEHWN